MRAALYPLSKCVMYVSVSRCLALVQHACPAVLPDKWTVISSEKYTHAQREREREKEKGGEREHTKGDPLIISLPAPIVW